MDSPRHFCPNCGAEIFNPQQGYCLNCGAQIASSEVKEYNLITAWLSFFKRYADFKGRSRRQEYWFAYLANSIIGMAFYIVMLIAVAAEEITDYSSATAGMSLIVASAAMVYSIATVIPNFAIQTRRLHDTGRSGKLLLLWFIPGVLSLITIGASLAAMAISMSARSYGMYYNYSYDSAEYLLEHMAATSGVALVIAFAVLFLAAIASMVLSIMFLVFFCQEGDRGENKYGKSPKYLN